MNLNKRNGFKRITGTRSPAGIVQQPDAKALGTRRVWIRYCAWPIAKPTSAKERRA